MYIDRRLWAFTAGVRVRIAWTVLLGMLAVSAGIARLALLGWLLGRVLSGAPLAAVVMVATAVALLIGLRGALDYARTLVAHQTAARVQARRARRSTRTSPRSARPTSPRPGPGT